MKRVGLLSFKIIMLLVLLLYLVSPSSCSDPVSVVDEEIKPPNLANKLEQLKVSEEFYKNESEYWKNVYENESFNVSNQNIMYVKNEIFNINQQVIKIDQTIMNIENKVNIICFAVAFTLFESLVSISVRVKNYFKTKNGNE